MKYIICSNKHYRHGEYHWLFWGPDGNGYTHNFKAAGLYNKNYRDGEYPIVESRGDVFKYETFMVAICNVQNILGKKEICITR